MNGTGKSLWRVYLSRKRNKKLKKKQERLLVQLLRELLCKNCEDIDCGGCNNAIKEES